MRVHARTYTIDVTPHLKEGLKLSPASVFGIPPTGTRKGYSSPRASSAMKTQSKLKNPPCPLFSCGIFRHCTQSVLSPTTTQTPALPPPFPTPSSDPTPSQLPPPQSDAPTLPSSSSSSSSTSQSFTQWRFPLPKPPFLHNLPTESDPPPESASGLDPTSPIPSSTLPELFHAAELQLSSGDEADRLSAIQMLEKMLVPNPLPDSLCGPAICPPAVMAGVVGYLKEPTAARAATKVLLALCLAEANRRVAVEVGAVAEVVEAVAGLEGAAAERALAVLELLCTVPEGAAGLRAHALAVPMLVEMMGKMGGRGKECAISVVAGIFGGGADGPPPPPVAAQAVVLALQGECSARGRRKGTQLLKSLQENGRLDLTEGS
ncbi:hypothetical protein ACLOJK_021182 [Asimina triloba]